MAYPTHVHLTVPIRPVTADMLHRAIRWATNRNITTVQVTLSDDTQATVPIGDVQREVNIARLDVALAQGDERLVEEQALIDSYNAQRDTLIAER